MGKPSLKKIGILTSSRADYGIYSPLIDYWENQNWLNFEIIIFGSHLLNENISYLNSKIERFSSKIKIVGEFEKTNTSMEVVKIYSKIINDFSYFWNNNRYDCIISLGDRFEMSAAIQSTIPFHNKIVHIHGGETSLGSIDNIYRHQITSASHLHFTSTKQSAYRVSQILGSNSNIFNIGSLSISGLDLNKVTAWGEVSEKLKIPNYPFILVTLHPETNVSSDFSIELEELSNVLNVLINRYFILVTGTNTDQNYESINIFFKNFQKANPNKTMLVETLGRDFYFSALKNCSFLLGNTSSGIIEAASFGKFVINIGNRQLGRIANSNVLNSPFNSGEILKKVNIIENFDFVYKGANIYKQKNSVKRITNEIKKYLKC